MHAVVAVTDKRWSDFLSARPHLTEANFWTPSNIGFRALTTDEPMLFKTHAPHNRLVGGGFLSGFVTLRVSEAWRFFGDGNGRATDAQVLDDVKGYRMDQGKVWVPDPVIGCILLRNIFFAPSETDLPAPPEFSRGGIQRYRRYDLTEPANDHIASTLGQLETTARPDLAWSDDLQLDVAGPVVDTPRLTTPRVGQSAFKALVLAPLSATARSPDHESRRCWRRPTSGLSGVAASTESTTACCYAATYTSCSTMDPSASTTACGCA